MPLALGIQQPLGHQGMDVGVEVEILAEGVEGEEEGRASARQSQGGAKKLGQRLLRDGTEAPEEGAIAAKERAQYFGQGEDDVTVGYRQENVVHQVGGGLENLALMAGGTEPTSLAGEGDEVFVRAMVAADAGEATFEDAALKELPEDLGDDGTERAEAELVGLRIAVHEGVVVTLDTLPHRGFARVSGSVGFHARPPGFPSSGSNGKWNRSSGDQASVDLGRSVGIESPSTRR